VFARSKRATIREAKTWRMPLSRSERRLCCNPISNQTEDFTRLKAGTAAEKR
jgi:hypothetical protein